MSWSILLKYKDGEIEEIPFSCHSTFEEIWLPKIKELKLELLLDIGLGAYPDLTKQELELLILEINKLKEIAEEGPLKERLIFVISKLEKIIFEDYQWITFG